MLAYNPWVLVFDPGFQLSVLATLGLILLAPIFNSYGVFHRAPEWLRESGVTTLACYLATLPLLMYLTGTMSLIAIPVNVLVVPFVPYATVLCMVAAGAGMIIPSIAPWIGYPAHILLAYIVSAAEFGAHVPYVFLQIPVFSAWWLLGMYGALALFVFTAKNPALNSAG
jgi:competence protein ComEC